MRSSAEQRAHQSICIGFPVCPAVEDRRSAFRALKPYLKLRHNVTKLVTAHLARLADAAINDASSGAVLVAQNGNVVFSAALFIYKIGR